MPQKSTFNTLQFKVTLLETKPLVWREIWLPATHSFYQFHLAVQAAFGWENSHLFQFCKNGMSDEHSIGIPNDDFVVTDARKVKLNKMIRKPGDRLMYVYDFGDHWEHQIDLEAVTNNEVHIALCVNGAAECPPENVGGIGGYERMLEELGSGTREQQKQYRDWLRLSANQKWNPEYYNQREVNKRMYLLSPEKFTFG